MYRKLSTIFIILVILISCTTKKIEKYNDFVLIKNQKEDINNFDLLRDQVFIDVVLKKMPTELESEKVFNLSNNDINDFNVLISNLEFSKNIPLNYQYKNGFYDSYYFEIKTPSDKYELYVDGKYIFIYKLINDNKKLLYQLELKNENLEKFISSIKESNQATNVFYNETSFCKTPDSVDENVDINDLNKVSFTKGSMLIYKTNYIYKVDLDKEAVAKINILVKNIDFKEMLPSNYSICTTNNLGDLYVLRLTNKEDTYQLKISDNILSLSNNKKDGFKFNFILDNDELLQYLASFINE